MYTYLELDSKIKFLIFFSKQKFICKILILNLETQFHPFHPIMRLFLS